GHLAGAKFALAVALPVLFLNLLGFWAVITKAATWWVIAGGAVFFAKPGRAAGLNPLLSFFFIGAFTAYFDFLTTPLLTFVIPAMTYFFVVYREKEGLGYQTPFKVAGFSFAFWAAGYFGLWIAKFALATAVLGPDAISDILFNAGNRLRGQSEHIDNMLPGTAIIENFEALKSLWMPLTVLVFFILPFIRKRRRDQASKLLRQAPIFAVLAGLPLLWLEVFSNHSQIHAAFTHVNFAPLLILLGLILFEQTPLLLTDRSTQGHQET
ncbi:MAG: hypothetical protein AAF986_01610, partial [Pseudomonadota bacterium]